MLFSFFFLLNCSKKQTANAELQQNDTVNILLTGSRAENRSAQSKIQDYKKAFSILKKQDNTQSNRENLIKVAAGFNTLSEYELLSISNSLLLRRSLEYNDTTCIAYSYYYSGNVNFYNQVRDSAFFYFLKAEKLFLKKAENSVLGDLYLSKSAIQLSYIDFLGAEYSATQALKYARLKNDKLGQYDALTNLGIASHNSENFQKSIEYHLQALNLAKDDNLNPEYFLQEISLNNIGNCYLYLKDFKNASVEFQKALQNSTLPKEKPGLYATLLDNLAYSKF